MKNLKKKDILLFISIVLVAAILFIVGVIINQRGEKVSPSQEGEISYDDSSIASLSPSPEIVVSESEPDTNNSEEEGTEYSNEVKAATAAYLETNPADSYLVITSNKGSYQPIPLDGDRTFKYHYGETEYNLIHTGINSVYVEESTCENQNCVGQGEVTLENKNSRVLGGMIVCLPHELTLELLDREETEQYLLKYYTALQEEVSNAS